MSKKKVSKKPVGKKKAIKKPIREKVCGEANKVLPLKKYVEKHGVSQSKSEDTLWNKLLKRLGFSG